MDNAQSFASFAVEAGYGISDPIEGEWTRCPAPGDRGGKKSATYRFFNDERPYGTIHDKRSGEVIEWRGEVVKRDPDAAERMKDRQRRREQDRLNRQAAASLIAQRRWRSASPVKSHPYLEKKQIQPHGIRREGKSLIVPMRASTGCIVSLQSIYADGAKFYLEDGQRDGSVFLIGPRMAAWEGPVALAEGLATASSVNEATGWPCFVTFDASGMVAASAWIARKWPKRQYVVAGDDDWHLPLRDKPLPNVGREKAGKAAALLSGVVAFPNRRGGDWTDFNDQHCHYGLDDVRQTLESVRF